MVRVHYNVDHLSAIYSSHPSDNWARVSEPLLVMKTASVSYIIYMVHQLAARHDDSA